MSDRTKRGNYFGNQPQAAEIHQQAEHAHEVGQLHGKQEYLTGNEHERQALELERSAQSPEQEVTVGHGILGFGHKDIALLAYQRWTERGCPIGSPETDWFAAVKELRTRALAHE